MTEKIRDRESLFSAVCECGHTARWHSHKGAGDCEHNADCSCRRFVSLAEARKAALDKTDCTNGPDEDGNWPCDPKVIYDGREAECQTCGAVAAWRPR